MECLDKIEKSIKQWSFENKSSADALEMVRVLRMAAEMPCECRQRGMVPVGQGLARWEEGYQCIRCRIRKELENLPNQ